MSEHNLTPEQVEEMRGFFSNPEAKELKLNELAAQGPAIGEHPSDAGIAAGQGAGGTNVPGGEVAPQPYNIADRAPKTPEEFQINKSTWERSLDQIIDPTSNQNFLFNLGLDIAQPIAPGQSQLGHVGNALQGGVKNLQAAREGKEADALKARSEESRLALEGAQTKVAQQKANTENRALLSADFEDQLIGAKTRLTNLQADAIKSGEVGANGKSLTAAELELKAQQIEVNGIYRRYGPTEAGGTGQFATRELAEEFYYKKLRESGQQDSVYTAMADLALFSELKGETVREMKLNIEGTFTPSLDNYPVQGEPEFKELDPAAITEIESWDAARWARITNNPAELQRFIDKAGIDVYNKYRKDK